jgi:anti-sigma factor RsiW
MEDKRRKASGKEAEEMDTMRSDEVYALMMEALDGELSEDGLAELEFHLRARPDLAREWHAIRHVDALMRSAPVLYPAADFTQRTLARLPNARQRLWISLVVYLMIMASGLIPLAAIAWLAIQLVPALGEPAFFRSLWQGVLEFGHMASVVLSALLTGAGQFVSEQPAILAWFVVLIGIVALWAGVYSRLVWQPRRNSS